MKQYITKKQWNELSDEQKRNPSWYFIDEVTGKLLFLNYPSIGQMIEFLREKEKDDLFDMKKLQSLILLPEILCDSLWETVKETI